MEKLDLKKREIIDHFIFDWNEENQFYECRGEVFYDDEHDEIPEPALWKAAYSLKVYLEKTTNYNWDYDYSEKGWVEVIKLGKK